MNDTLVPIATRWAGCQFRSRLEARWAVYMDTVGIRWKYETEGYQLPSGWYLPDFYCWWPDEPERPWWAEVKGHQVTDLARRLLMELCEATEMPAQFLGDFPRLADGSPVSVVQERIHVRPGYSYTPSPWLPLGRTRPVAPIQVKPQARLVAVEVPLVRRAVERACSMRFEGR